ncbi:serine/threonine protein kinase [Catenulispora sp. GAS73]|uniref:serine/threonine-protein kinase n=1 Tax=Catenulispora sp. GAS73 TaxID=3156269 RepID=UPI00351296AE
MNVQRLRALDPRGVGPYQFLGRLGSGGMGLVCLARAADGRLVAVKLVHQEIAADPDYRRRFAREVRAAKAVTGRFTATVLDADPDAPQPWYAAEFIDGPTLGEVVRQSGPVPPRALRALAAGLADALAALETAGLVHRDVKPDNILLAPDGPKLIDFGLAHRDTDSVLTHAGSVLGSPGYMSPEQIAGRGATTASDVFALGAVLAYAVQGHGPFGGGPSEARMYRTRFSEAQLAGVPDEFRPLLRRCLAKEPADRPTPRDLIALWPVRPDELAILIQVGRSHHAAEQPVGDRLYGAPTEAAPAKAVPAKAVPGTDANSPTEALPLERGTAVLPGGPATAGLDSGTSAPSIQPPEPAAASGLSGAAAAGGPPNQAVPLPGFQQPESAATPGLLAGAPNQYPPHISPEPAGPSPLPSVQRPERTPTSITFQPPTAEPWHSPLPHAPNHPTPPPPPPASRPPWWHHPVAADRLPGGGLRDVLLGLAGAGLLMLFGLLPASTGTGASTAVGIAFAATALALGFLLGARRGALAMAVYNATAVLSPAAILPGGLAAELREPAAGVSLDVLVLLLAAGGIARVGGLARPPLGFVVGMAAYIAGQAVIVSMAAHQGGGGFVTVWRADTDGWLIYRDAAIAAGCGAAVGFLALLGSSKAVVDADGPYRATGVNR